MASVIAWLRLDPKNSGWIEREQQAHLSLLSSSPESGRTKPRGLDPGKRVQTASKQEALDICSEVSVGMSEVIRNVPPSRADNGSLA